MNRLKVSPAKSGRLIRFKCTCGHYEDFKNAEASRHNNAHGLVVLDGFQELP